MKEKQALWKELEERQMCNLKKDAKPTIKEDYRREQIFVGTNDRKANQHSFVILEYVGTDLVRECFFWVELKSESELHVHLALLCKSPFSTSLPKPSWQLFAQGLHKIFAPFRNLKFRCSCTLEIAQAELYGFYHSFPPPLQFFVENPDDKVWKSLTEYVLKSEAWRESSMVSSVTFSVLEREAQDRMYTIKSWSRYHKLLEKSHPPEASSYEQKYLVRPFHTLFEQNRVGATPLDETQVTLKPSDLRTPLCNKMIRIVKETKDTKEFQGMSTDAKIFYLDSQLAQLLEGLHNLKLDKRDSLTLQQLRSFIERYGPRTAPKTTQYTAMRHAMEISFLSALLLNAQYLSDYLFFEGPKNEKNDPVIQLWNKGFLTLVMSDHRAAEIARGEVVHRKRWDKYIQNRHTTQIQTPDNIWYVQVTMQTTVLALDSFLATDNGPGSIGTPSLETT